MINPAEGTNPMTMPELTVVAQGTLPAGERWEVRAGGTDEDYYTFLRTVHPDGRYDEGGMGGPKLPDGAIVTTYIGQADGGLLRVLARTISVVFWMRLELGSGEVRVLTPVGHDGPLGLSFYAALLPPAQTVTALLPLSLKGEVIGP
jgi:hypothetical protein